MNSVTELNGLNISYDRVCDTNNPKAVLLFLHGWGGSSNSWEPNIRELKNKFDCIALNFPGFGLSDEPENIWGVAEYAIFVRDFVKRMNLHKLVLVGKSFGGRVALNYANNWPETLSNLILVSAAGIEKAKFLTKIVISLASFGKALITKKIPAVEPFARKVFYKITGIQKDISDYKWEVKKLVTNTDLSEEAKHISVPTLVVWGKDDNILPVELGKKLNNLIKNSSFVQIQGGHNAHSDSSSEFNLVLLRYLES